MNNIYASAGLLTYSPFALPSRALLTDSGHDWTMVTELTAAGQSGIYTRFPFNSFQDNTLKET